MDNTSVTVKPVRNRHCWAAAKRHMLALPINATAGAHCTPHPSKPLLYSSWRHPYCLHCITIPQIVWNYTVAVPLVWLLSLKIKKCGSNCSKATLISNCGRSTPKLTKKSTQHLVRWFSKLQYMAAMPRQVSVNWLVLSFHYTKRKENINLSF